MSYVLSEMYVIFYLLSVTTDVIFDNHVEDTHTRLRVASIQTSLPHRF